MKLELTVRNRRLLLEYGTRPRTTWERFGPVITQLATLVAARPEIVYDLLQGVKWTSPANLFVQTTGESGEVTEEPLEDVLKTLLAEGAQLAGLLEQLKTRVMRLETTTPSH